MTARTCETCNKLPYCSWEYGAHPDDPKCLNYTKSPRTSALDELIASTADQYGDIEP